VVDLLQADQASRWRSGRRTPAERYVSLLPDPDRCLDEATDLAYGEFLLRRELGEGPALAEYLVRFPTLADRLRALAELDDALDGEPSMPPDAPAVRPGGAAPQGAQRFRVLRPHARGGLGAVFVALDGELNREVALKRILDHHADDPSSRRRFVLEAEITGGLEHPGIVPVYGLGAQGDGRPYYAMRFVRGDTLTRAIDRFHADAGAPADPGRRSLALRELLRRFLDVCNAIDYAHSRGVLHRDIKPSNVIVGKHGETLVVDWGLAKARGKEDLLDPDAERPLVPSSASGSAETLPGRALGTPAYMSPEQARGDLDRLGPRSDVYSLGATLYCLLTGRPPFQSDDLASVLQAVQEGDFPPPRRANPRVDRPLEAVCLRAMALLPEGRYESARDLAREVERWLADEPVSAYREPIPARVGRWARRHRTSVAVAVALLLAAVVALAVGAVLLASANTRIEAGAKQARENAEVARINAAEAEENFKLARDAVDRYLVGVEENDLLREPYMAGLRAELLGSAREFY
jgi:serine/threonine protein kinase